MSDGESTVRTRELGIALRTAVAVTGMNNAELAHRMGWSPSKVTNLFKGKRGAIDTDVAAILALCGIKGPERDRLMGLARQPHGPGWWQEHGNRLPEETRTLINHEDAAVAITSFQSVVIPGLLQTADYIRARMRSSAIVADEEIEQRVAARLHRQRILERRPPMPFRFFIDEHALRRIGPGRAIMSEQVHHLLRLSVRRNIEIRAVPDAAGFHIGVNPFHLMEFAEFGPVVFVEDLTSALFHERADTIAAYRRVVADLARVALTEGQSREWIVRLATELGESPEGAP